MDIRIGAVCELACEAMRAAGYMGSTIGEYRKYFRYLERACEGGGYDEEAASRWAAARKPDGSTYCDNVVGMKK